MKSAFPFVLALLLLAATASAQTHRWHDLTPDSLRAAPTTFFHVAAARDSVDVRRVLYASYERRDTYTGGLLRSDDDGASWRYLPARVSHIAVPYDHPNLVYGLNLGHLYKSTDGGRTWRDLTPALRAAFGAPDVSYLTRVEFDPSDTARVVVARSLTFSGGLFFSDDGGRSFRYVSFGAGSDGSKLNVVASPAVPGRVYAASFVSGTQNVQRLVVLDGWGRTTTATYFDAGPEVRQDVSGLLIDDEDTIYASEQISRDGGASWERTPESGRYNSYAVSSRGGVLYALRRRDETFRNYDHHVSYDRGATWTPLDASVQGWSGAAAVDIRDSTLFTASTYGLFAYARSGSVGVGIDEVPDADLLTARAYPNPSREAVAVGVDGPPSARVTVEVFDVLGRRVATLTEGAPPGRFVWGAPNVPPGTYFVRVREAATSRTRTLTLTRLR